MGEVYRAHDGAGRVIALKLLEPALVGDDRFRRRFLRESELAASLHHPHIVQTVRAGEADGRLYLAMEFVEGHDLRRLLREEGRLEPERAVALVEQVADALDAAHAAGLVHRDIKPGNILLTAGEEQAYVCDFGLARHVSSVSSLTGDRGFVGTVDYVPPEQIEGKPVDGRADVYSLACVLYECLAGARPFERDSELSVVFAHLNDPPPKLTDARSDLPAAFDTVFASGLAKSQDERYSSCGELAAAARAALRGETVPRARRRRRRLVPVVAAVALAVTAGISTVLLTRGNATEAPVTITPTSIAGARLGDSNVLLERMWGAGYQKLSMQTPPDYSVLTHRARNVSAYFIGTSDKTVEITTWNSRDRTAEGIGPCSTVDELKKAYGARLKPSPHNTHNGVVHGWTLGDHLFFAMGPGLTPKVVEAVAIYSNPLGWAGFNALNEGPCAPSVDASPVERPQQVAIVRPPALPTKLSSSDFSPRIEIRVPNGWVRRSDTADAFVAAAANGTTLSFYLDPVASTMDGRPLPNVSGTPRGLVSWLQRRRGLNVSAPQTTLLGQPVLTATSVDLRRSSTGAGGAIAVVAFPGKDPSSLRSSHGRPMRLYLAPIRIDTLVHTLAIVVAAGSNRALAAALPATGAIIKNLRVSAAAAPNLSALSGFCSGAFNGTCRGELAAGTYTSSSLRPRLTYTVPVGWTNSGDQVGFFGLIPPGGDYTAVDIGKRDYLNVFTSIAVAREGCADGPGSVHTPEGFVRWLLHEPGLTVTPPLPVTVGGLSGFVVDIRMRKGWTKTCPWSQGIPAAQVLTGLSPSPDQLAHGMLPPPMVMRLYLLHYKDGTLGIEIDEVKGSSKLAAYSAIVKSFRFGPG
jgi:serine/threonine-protein kinase